MLSQTLSPKLAATRQVLSGSERCRSSVLATILQLQQVCCSAKVAVQKLTGLDIDTLGRTLCGVRKEIALPVAAPVGLICQRLHLTMSRHRGAAASLRKVWKAGDVVWVQYEAATQGHAGHAPRREHDLERELRQRRAGSGARAACCSAEKPAAQPRGDEDITFEDATPRIRRKRGG